MSAPRQRPLLRYFGGKWQLRHWIGEHLPEHQFYAEPFAGAASVLLGKAPAPKGEIINDLNGDVVNLFRVLQCREKGAELVRRLKYTPYAKAEFEACKEPSDEPVERARRMVALSFMGVSLAGSSRRSSYTGFRMGNVDLNRVGGDGKPTFRNTAKDWANWKRALPIIRRRLEHVMIYERDALEFIDLMDSPDCLLYVDPPYHHSGRSSHRYKVEFTDHMGLVQRLNNCKAKVVLSGYACDEYGWLELNGWQRVDKEYRANMSKARRVESLWIKGGAARTAQEPYPSR